jgi:hypothetical protein
MRPDAPGEQGGVRDRKEQARGNRHLEAHEEVGAVLEVVPPLRERPARGLDVGVGLRGGVELPDLAAHVGILRAQPRVPAALGDPQPPHLRNPGAQCSGPAARFRSEPSLLVRGSRSVAGEMATRQAGWLDSGALEGRGGEGFDLLVEIKWD